MAIVVRAVVVGALVALVPANAWPVLLATLGMPLAVIAEASFLAAFIWWAHGGGPPRALRTPRRTSFRGVPQGAEAWTWCVVAAVSFAVTVHAAIVLLFRLVPFPAEAFRQGYDVTFIPTRALQWLAVVVSATSAGVCEEIGFRGYTQQPIEERHGARLAILASSLLFMLTHLAKGWALVGMIPIVLGAGALLGLLAWSSRSLVPGIIGHTIMDVGLFGYWWTGLAGTFAARPIGETGLDGPFVLACMAFAGSLSTVLFAGGRIERRAKA